MLSFRLFGSSEGPITSLEQLKQSQRDGSICSRHIDDSALQEKDEQGQTALYLLTIWEHDQIIIKMIKQKRITRQMLLLASTKKMKSYVFMLTIMHVDLLKEFLENDLVTQEMLTEDDGYGSIAINNLLHTSKIHLFAVIIDKKLSSPEMLEHEYLQLVNLVRDRHYLVADKLVDHGFVTKEKCYLLSNSRRNTIDYLENRSEDDDAFNLFVKIYQTVFDISERRFKLLSLIVAKHFSFVVRLIKHGFVTKEMCYSTEHSDRNIVAILEEKSDCEINNSALEPLVKIYESVFDDHERMQKPVELVAAERYNIVNKLINHGFLTPEMCYKKNDDDSHIIDILTYRSQFDPGATELLKEINEKVLNQHKEVDSNPTYLKYDRVVVFAERVGHKETIEENLIAVSAVYHRIMGEQSSNPGKIQTTGSQLIKVCRAASSLVDDPDKQIEGIDDLIMLLEGMQTNITNNGSLGISGNENERSCKVIIDNMLWILQSSNDYKSRMSSTSHADLNPGQQGSTQLSSSWIFVGSNDEEVPEPGSTALVGVNSQLTPSTSPH